MPVSTIFARRASESNRSAGSMTPANEMSSWLGDDVCTVCGSAVPSGNLHCSIECRQEDAKSSAAPRETQRARPVPDTGRISSDGAASQRKRLSASSLPALSALSDSNHAIKSQAQSSMPREAAHDLTGQKFRYAPPSSPHVTAKYSAALTSPALAAHDRTAAAQRTHVGKAADNGRTPDKANISGDKEWMSSSESSHGAMQRHYASDPRVSQRRSSSRSTFSSRSDALSTDPSTPSPALRSDARRDNDEDDFEPTDLNLPPSIYPAASMLLNASGQRDTSNAAQTRLARTTQKAASPKGPSTKLASTPTGDSQPLSTMSFARRPSRTNMPAPVLFTSPVLATTVMKKTSPSNKSGRSPGVRSGGLVDMAGIRNASSSNGGGSTSPINASYSARRQHPIAMRKIPSSPPQVASAASSAGKTLRAYSPSRGQHSLDGVGGGSGPLCGRFGCRGLSSSASSDEELRRTDGLSLSHQDRGAASNRPALLHGHKHTHSAAADLQYLGSSQRYDKYNESIAERAILPPGPSKAALVSKLIMTPASALRAVEEDVKNTAIGKPAEQQVREDEVFREMRSPPRGRSKARGRSSTSRRSPSPPRGVARRGHSVEHGQSPNAQNGAKVVVSTSISPSRSSPIALRSANPSLTTVLDKAQDARSDGHADDARGRRGRSPTARNRPPASIARECDGDKEAQGAVRNARSAAARGSRAQIMASESSMDDSFESTLNRESCQATRPRTSTRNASASSGYDDVELDEL